MTHSGTVRPGRHVLTVIGDVDEMSADMLADAVDAQCPGPDLVDCRFVPFMSAAGLTVLLEARQRRPFRTVASTAVRRVVELCELTDAIGLVDASGPPALDDAAFAVAVHDADGRFIYVNDALSEVNGLPGSAHLGARPGDLFDVVDDEVSAVLDHVMQRRVIESRTVAGSTLRGPGTWECHYLPVRHDVAGGIPFDGVVSVVDVTPAPVAPIASTLRLSFGPKPTLSAS